MTRPGHMMTQSLLGLCVVAELCYWQWDVLQEVYFSALMMPWTWIVVGVLAIVLVIALVHGLFLLYSYIREDAAIDAFTEQLDFTLTAAGLASIRKSLIVSRYRAVQQSRGSSDCLAVLSSLLWRQEKTRAELLLLARRVMLGAGLIGAVAEFAVLMYGFNTGELMSALDWRLWGTLLVHDIQMVVSFAAIALAGYLVLLLLDSRVTRSREYVCQRIDEMSVRQLVPRLSERSSATEGQ